MKNTPENRKALEAMRACCEGSHWRMNFAEDGNRLVFEISIRDGEPDYIPEIRCESCRDNRVELFVSIKAGTLINHTKDEFKQAYEDTRRVFHDLWEAAEIHGIELVQDD